MNLWALLGRLTDHLTGGRRKDPSVEELMPEHEVTADVLILRQMSDNPSVSLCGSCTQRTPDIPTTWYSSPDLLIGCIM